MITNQHRFAKQILDADERKTYQKNMCSVCHAFGTKYGFISRFITNHEIILLNMLTQAQMRDESEPTPRRCPLNPMLKVDTYANVGSEFAAAVGIELVNASIEDDIIDSDGRDIKARILHSSLKGVHQTALTVLKDLEFDTSLFTELGHKQSLAEGNTGQDPTLPSAETGAAIFAKTAQLAGNPQNEDILAEIGANYGIYLYLKDAYTDFHKDISNNEYNFLRRYAKETDSEIILSRQGLAWLLTKFRKIHNSLETSSKKLELYRYGDTIPQLLYRPVVKVIENLSEQMATDKDIIMPQWRLANAFQAATLSLPIALTTGVNVATNGNLTASDQVLLCCIVPA